MMRAVLHIFLSCCLLLMSLVVHAEDATARLEHMATTAKQLNYEGVFSYRVGKKMQAIRIVHRANQQGEVERLVSLNGVAREVIRNNEIMTCIYPEGKSVQPNHRPLGRGFPSDFLNRLSLASAYYQLTLGGEERIAGHNTQELHIIPVDDYRYGYHLWVDKDSDLLLQYDLVDDHGEVLETISFTSVEMGHDIPDELLKTQILGNQMTWNRAEKVMVIKTMANKAKTPWQMVWMPEGFVLVAQQNRLRANNGASIEQYVYSDGLNSISIFMEKNRAQHGHLQGGSRMGATNAFGTIINDYFVTIVGEVPERTVEKVGNSIQYAEHEQQ